jgi:prepilin-type N-terminal cleavage/methylation domain-containing protein
MPTRLKAFTILELLVAMAITGLVVSISGLVYNMLDSQFFSYRKSNEAIVSVFLLDSSLRKDFFEGRSIIAADDRTLIIVKHDVVEYRFNDEAVLRIQAGRTDTFYLSAQNIKMLLDNIEESPGAINELSFETEVMGESEAFHYLKRCGTEMMINKEEDGY